MTLLKNRVIDLFEYNKGANSAFVFLNLLTFIEQHFDDVLLVLLVLFFDEGERFLIAKRHSANGG